MCVCVTAILVGNFSCRHMNYICQFTHLVFQFYEIWYFIFFAQVRQSSFSCGYIITKCIWSCCWIHPHVWSGVIYVLVTVQMKLSIEETCFIHCLTLLCMMWRIGNSEMKLPIETSLTSGTTRATRVSGPAPREMIGPPSTINGDWEPTFSNAISIHTHRHLPSRRCLFLPRSCRLPVPLRDVPHSHTRPCLLFSTQTLSSMW
jgi:hypothetical protein